MGSLRLAAQRAVRAGRALFTRGHGKDHGSGISGHVVSPDLPAFHVSMSFQRSSIRLHSWRVSMAAQGCVLLSLLDGRRVSGKRGQVHGQAGRVQTAGADPLRRARLVRLACALCCAPLGNAVGADDALADDIATVAQPAAAVAARVATESGAAAPSASPERAARFAFEHDNDLFVGTDRDYTGATRLAWSPAGSSGSHGERMLFTLAQDAWTPDDTDAELPPTGQRPYAGWLNLSAARATVVGEGTWMRYASLGVLGPTARAEAVQRFLHEASGSAPVNGWDSERGDRAALQLGFRGDFSAARRRIAAGSELDLGTHAGAALGTVMAYLHAGASLRIGRGTTRTVGPPDTVPGAPDFAAAFAPAGARYVHVGVGARAVGRDETLKGDTSRACAVDAEPLVGDLRAGVVAAFGRWRVAYTHALRTRSYRTGRATHTFGSLNIALVLH